MSRDPDVSSERKFHDEYFSDHSSRKRENQYYDQFSKDFIQNEMILRMGDLRGKAVLYYGCGENISLFKKLKELGADVYLFDLSIIALNNVRKVDPKAKAAVCDAHKLPFKDENFDIVVGRGILHHLNIDSALIDIKRVLRTDGKVYFIEPLAVNPFLELYRFLTPKSRTDDEQPFRLKEIQQIKSHFKETRIEFYFWLTLIATLLKKVLPENAYQVLFVWLYRIDKGLFKIISPLKYLSWIGLFELSK